MRGYFKEQAWRCAKTAHSNWGSDFRPAGQMTMLPFQPISCSTAQKLDRAGIAARRPQAVQNGNARGLPGFRRSAV